MHKPPFTFFRRLNWSASLTRCKAFFDRFPYEAFNARLAELDEPHEQIHYRRANIEATFNWIFHLTLESIKKGQKAAAPLRFALSTCRTSLATRLRRTTRTIDRHLNALLAMGALQQRERTGRGIELVLTASLFVFVTAPPAAAAGPALPASAPAGQPAEAAADEPADAWLEQILRNTAIAERIAQKFGAAAALVPTSP